MNDIRRVPSLPDWHELFAAVGGHVGDSPSAHPVTRCARALAELHLAERETPEGPPGFAILRKSLIDRIDAWISARCSFATLCSESPGAAIDRMACAHLEALAVLHAEDSDELDLHRVWHALGEHANAWSDLVDEVVRGQPRPSSPDQRRKIVPEWRTQFLIPVAADQFCGRIRTSERSEDYAQRAGWYP